MENAETELIRQFNNLTSLDFWTTHAFNNIDSDTPKVKEVEKIVDQARKNIVRFLKRNFSIKKRENPKLYKMIIEYLTFNLCEEGLGPRNRGLYYCDVKHVNTNLNNDYFDIIKCSCCYEKYEEIYDNEYNPERERCSDDDDDDYDDDD